MPISTDNDTMFPPYTFDLESFTIHCNRSYGVPPRPHWVTTYYGGHVCISIISFRTPNNFLICNNYLLHSILFSFRIYILSFKDLVATLFFPMDSKILIALAGKHNSINK